MLKINHFIRYNHYKIHTADYTKTALVTKKQEITQQLVNDSN